MGISMKDHPRLNLALELMDKQNSLYKPTSFWSTASERIISEINQHGISNFRSLPSALNYFVPNYGIPASGLNSAQVDLLIKSLKEQFPASTKSHLVLEKMLSGYQNALADYRVFIASEQSHEVPNLLSFSESSHGSPIEQWQFQGKWYSRSSLNYLLGLSFLKNHLGGDIPKTILEIGGGFGTLGEIWSQAGITNWKYIDIDIPPTQYAADYYLKQFLGEANVSEFNEFKLTDKIEISKLKPASVLCSWQVEQLIGQIDLFVNFISFQEMEPNVVLNYLKHVDKLNARWILLRNMREGKQKKRDGHAGVVNPIQTDDYLDMLPKYKLINRNIHPFGYETVDGFNSELMILKRL
jgi:putative sugar O-methyltransferase